MAQAKSMIVVRVSRASRRLLQATASVHKRSMGAEAATILEACLPGRMPIDAMIQACEWLRQNAPGRALEVLDEQIRRHTSILTGANCAPPAINGSDPATPATKENNGNDR